jgi:UDP-N-acetylglucosamine:LPS N-acetylglucosamine transferase
MGLANRITSILATKVFTSYPISDKKKYIHTGHIMNPEMLDSVRSLSKEENEQLNILVIGGSQ